MVGIFQIFGISFLFWMLAGLLRFIFETLVALRAAPRTASRLNLTVSALGGVGISTSLFFLVFVGFGLSDGFRLDASLLALALATLIIWLTCIAIGAYLSTRIYIHEPYLVSLATGLGTIAASIALLTFADIHVALSWDTMYWEVGWVLITILTALLGGHIARALNALERERTNARASVANAARIGPSETAVLIAAHNEELSIGSTIRSLLAFMHAEDIYVASDGSSDTTVQMARELGCIVNDIQPNRGKAGALAFTIQKNKLLEKYKAVFLLDADMQVAPDFLVHALPSFDDPNVAAVSGYFETLWPKHFIPQWRLLVPAYRIRLWRVLQFLVRYGQTWRYLNASPIIPGGASIYRTSVLREIKIDAPGLIIEDFNMTFEMHHKKLGNSIFEPRSRVLDQEPYSVRDFAKQVRRWYLGYFQTIKRHGVWPSLFCLFTYFFTIEMIVSALVFLVVPLFLIELLMSGRETLFIGYQVGGFTVTLLGILLSVFIFDYFITIVVALIERKPMLLIYGLFFFPVRYIEAAIFLYTIPVALFSKSDGTWKSPKRIAFET